MKKIILLTTALLTSASVYAVCTAPIDLKCNCQHPIIENGLLVCGPSYCGDKKCMPDGSCCTEENYCESSEQGKQCCVDNQTCDTTSGCVEKVCITDCTGQENGTECCTKDGNSGACLSNVCKTQVCDEGENFYVYYSEMTDRDTGNGWLTGCCANNPSKWPDVDPEPQCCPSEKPFVRYRFYFPDNPAGEDIYGCFQGDTAPNDCFGENPPEGNEKCSGQTKFDYCSSNNWGEWSCLQYANWSERICREWHRDCLSN